MLSQAQHPWRCDCVAWPLQTALAEISSRRTVIGRAKTRRGARVTTACARGARPRCGAQDINPLGR